jgi:hypothetical protein
LLIDRKKYAVFKNEEQQNLPFMLTQGRRSLWGEGDEVFAKLSGRRYLKCVNHCPKSSGFILTLG